jgi:hypothetical protein
MKTAEAFPSIFIQFGGPIFRGRMVDVRIEGHREPDVNMGRQRGRRGLAVVSWRLLSS